MVCSGSPDPLIITSHSIYTHSHFPKRTRSPQSLNQLTTLPLWVAQWSGRSLARVWIQLVPFTVYIVPLNWLNWIAHLHTNASNAPNDLNAPKTTERSTFSSLLFDRFFDFYKLFLFPCALGSEGCTRLWPRETCPPRKRRKATHRLWVDSVYSTQCVGSSA